jgi:formate hydrogenlyase subunit 6/NADH:ubiquinone oxidoreductase subunit I
MSDVIKNTIRPFRALRFLGRKPHTIRTPHEQHNDIEGDPLPTDRYRGMHVNDWDKCIGCGMCSMVCPCDAIEMMEIEGETKKRPEISYGRCCFCSFCEEACPVHSMHLTSNHTFLTVAPERFIFLPTPSIAEFEVEYTVSEEQLCHSIRKTDGPAEVAGDPRKKRSGMKRE